MRLYRKTMRQYLKLEVLQENSEIVSQVRTSAGKE
jgi:hypothetical protein